MVFWNTLKVAHKSLKFRGCRKSFPGVVGKTIFFCIFVKKKNVTLFLTGIYAFFSEKDKTRHNQFMNHKRKRNPANKVPKPNKRTKWDELKIHAQWLSCRLLLYFCEWYCIPQSSALNAFKVSQKPWSSAVFLTLIFF